MGLLVLVDLTPSFYSQLNGRYRWSVEAKVVLVPLDRPTMGVESAFQVPVFLPYAHLKEAAALEAAVGRYLAGTT